MVRPGPRIRTSSRQLDCRTSPYPMILNRTITAANTNTVLTARSIKKIHLYSRSQGVYVTNRSGQRDQVASRER